jgi:flagellar hook-associated protein FlgK
MSSFSAGLSAINVAQRAMEVIGQNIANANTPGYRRQVAFLSTRPDVYVGNLAIGTGVKVADVQQMRDNLIDNAVTNHAVDAGSTNAQLDALRQIETQLSTGDGSIHDLMEKFFNQAAQLAANPQDPAQRQVLVTSANTLARQFNTVADNLAQASRDVTSQAGQLITDINSRAVQIAQLNEQIRTSQAKGINSNDLIDQRDQLINEIADRAGVQVIPQDLGQKTVLVGGAPVVLGNTTTPLALSTDNQNNLIVIASGINTALPVTGGQLGGLLQVRNQFLPNYQGRLDTLANQFARQVDGIQATGLGLNGPQTFLAGGRSVSNFNTPLSNAGTGFPVQAGTLFVSVTNLATGTRTLTPLNLDPTTQGVTAIAAAFNTVPNVNAVTDSQTGTLKILAAPGFAFDFAGRIATSPTTSTFTGTAIAQVQGQYSPQVQGQYSGSANDVYTFTISGSGTVGTTPGLTLQVTNSAGKPVATLNVGQGYQPGTALTVANGVTVKLAAGTANNGDAFTQQLVAQPDSTGVLTALGLGTFFTGSTAANLAVQPTLLAHPDQIGASRSGQPGDGSNLTQLVAQRDVLSLGNGTQTLGQNYASLVADVGTEVRSLSDQQTQQQAIGQQLLAQQQSVSGVDPNEEYLQLVQFQRSYQAAAKYVSVVNDTLDALFQIIQ